MKNKEFEQLKNRKNGLKNVENLIERSKNVDSIVGVLSKEIRKNDDFSNDELPKIQSSKIEYLIEKFKNGFELNIISDQNKEIFQNYEKNDSEKLKIQNLKPKLKVSKKLVSNDLLSNLINFSNEEKRNENLDTFIVPNFQPESMKEIISAQKETEIEENIIFPFQQKISNIKIIEKDCNE
eukprot:gene10346-2760_t